MKKKKKLTILQLYMDRKKNQESNFRSTSSGITQGRLDNLKIRQMMGR